MINEDRMLKTLTFVNIHKHIKALFIMIIKWLGIIDDTLEKKADLIGGKVPAEQLPSYVDDVIDIAAFVTKTELVNNIGKANYTNKSFIVNSPTSDSLYNKIVITNANTSQNDWEIIDHEDGKIYINESNNHSYRWSGNSFVDLDKNFNDRLNVIENKLSIITLSGLTNANTSQNDWEIIDHEDGKIYINESNNHSYRWSGNSFVDLDKNFNDRLNVIENKLSIITLSGLTNNYDLSTATNGISTLKTKLLNNDNSANILLKIVNTNNKSYYCKILTRDITTVSTNISVNIDIENKGCIQTYNITDDNITLINNNATLFITSNTNNNKLECNKIISNITTAHISYNNIIYTQVDLSDTNSVRFIGYNSNGILNYYALNKSTGVIQTMNTYNIGKTCLYKANLSLTDNEKQNIQENLNVLYFTTNTNEARLAQIQKYDLKNKNNKSFSSVYNINNVIYYGVCSIYSNTEMSLTSFRKYSVITNIISLDTGEVITDFIMRLQEIFNYQSYKVLGGNKINTNDWYSALINSTYPTSIIVKEDNITNAVDDSTANKISISGKIIYEPTDNKIIEFSRGEETEDAIYFISNYSADQYKELKYNKSTKKFDAVSINNYTVSSSSTSDLFVDITGKLGNITDELHNQIINTPAIIFNNVIYFKTSTVDGIKIHFINYEENGDLSELIYTIASKSFTTNSVSNTIINKEVIISKAMKNIVPADIFTTSLLQTINIVENANRLNIIVKDNSSIKQTLTILNVSKTLQNGDLITANYSITCAFNGIIYYGNVENNVYNMIAYKTFYSLLYSSSGGGVN